MTIVFKKGASATGDCVSDGEIQLTNRQQAIYDTIKNNSEVTATGMAGTLADTLADTLALSKRTVEREIQFLRENGYIRKEGKKNKGVWVVLK